METAHILLVDDDPALLEALPLTVSLRMSNIEVHTAASATEALTRLQQHPYDAIVSDIKMPGMDGFDLLAITSRQYPDIPVLLITGHGEHDLAIRALRGGAYDYILKPIDRDDLIASLYRALHTRRLQQKLEAQQRTLERYALDLERLVEQRTGELKAAHAASEQTLFTLEDELRVALAHLKLAAWQVETSLPPSSRPEAFERGLAEMSHTLQALEDVAARVEQAAAIQGNHLAYEEARNLTSPS
jgi:YesN/AraC family two-component response regulator